MIALRGAIHVACFHHSCFLTGSYRCLTKTWMNEGTPHLFAQGMWWDGARRRKEGIVVDDRSVKVVERPTCSKVGSIADYVRVLKDIWAYIGRVNEMTGKMFTLFYRGLPKTMYSLEPSLFRIQCDARFDGETSDAVGRKISEILRKDAKDNAITWFGREKELVSAIRNEYPNLFGVGFDNLDVLTVIQHCEVPTRLMDITKNALVALYFAVADLSIRDDGIVYVFPVPQSELDRSVERRSAVNAMADPDFWRQRNIAKAQQKFRVRLLVSEKRPFVVAPRFLTERQKRQSGYFYFVPNKISRSEKILPTASEVDNDEYFKIEIDGRRRESIKRQLDELFNINEHYLFPENVRVFTEGLKRRESVCVRDATGEVVCGMAHEDFE